MKVVRTLTLAVLVLAAAVAALLFTPLGERPMAAVFPVGDQEPPRLEALEVEGARNRYLVCPTGMCGSAPHRTSPVYDISADALQQAWQDMIAREPRIQLLEDRGMEQDYVQRTPCFRFPDIVTVRVVSLPDSRASLAVYSRSVYGISDLGVNRRRVEDWLAKLDAQVAR